MSTPNYTIETSFFIVPKTSENVSGSLTPTTPSSLSESPFLNLRKTASDGDQANTFCEQLMIEKEALRKQLDVANNELHDLKNKLLQAARQKQALNQAHVKITELEEKISELTEENSKLITSQQPDQSSEKYQAILQQNVSEIKMLSSKIVEAEKAVRHYQQENSTLKLKLERVLNALNSSEESKEDLWTTIEQQEKQIEQLQNIFENQKGTYIQTLEELKKNLSELSSKNQELCEALQTQANEITELKSQNQPQDLLANEIAQNKRDIRLLKLNNNQLQALYKEKCLELDFIKQDLPSLRLETERSLHDNKFTPSTPSASTSCSRSLTAVSSGSGKVKFVRMKKSSKTQGDYACLTPKSAEKKILSIMTERRHLTKKSDDLMEKLKDHKKEMDQMNYFTSILNGPRSARERQVQTSQLPTEWENKSQAPLSRLLKSHEISQEELRRKHKSAAMFEKGNVPIHAL